MGIRNFTIAFLFVFAFTAILAGCAGALTTPSDSESTDQIPPPAPSTTKEASDLPAPQPTSTSFIDNPDILELRPSQTLPAGLERVKTPDTSPVVGEVPTEILEEIIADLVQRTGAARGVIQVVRAEAVVWNDGSLGCPQPGMAYIQILINGYWVMLDIEGTAYDYRVSGTEHFTLCEGGGNLPFSPSGFSPEK